MAQYPTYPIKKQGFSDALQDGVSWDRASNGSMRGRSLWVSPKRAIGISHVLDTVQWGELVSFYTTNRTLPIDLAIPEEGVVTAVFAGPPSRSAAGAGLWDVSVRFLET